MNQRDTGDLNHISILGIQQKPRVSMVIMDGTANPVLGSVRSQSLEKGFY